MYILSQFSWATITPNVYLFTVKVFYVKVSPIRQRQKRKSQPSIDSHTVSSTRIVSEPPADLLSISSAVAKVVQPAVQKIDILT